LQLTTGQRVPATAKSQHSDPTVLRVLHPATPATP
jgi:hypothetical protein